MIGDTKTNSLISIKRLTLQHKAKVWNSIIGYGLEDGVPCRLIVGTPKTGNNVWGRGGVVDWTSVSGKKDGIGCGKVPFRVLWHFTHKPA